MFGSVRSATHSPTRSNPPTMSYTQLSLEERYVIAHLKIAKFSLREIARRFGRHHSTIPREIKRNGPEQQSAFTVRYSLDDA